MATAVRTSLFYPEDGGSKFLRNVGNDSSGYRVSYHRRQRSSYSPHRIRHSSILKKDSESSCEISVTIHWTTCICRILSSAIQRRVVRWEALPPAFTLVSCLAYSSTLKIEAICSSETSDDTQRTTRRYIPEDGTLFFRKVLCCRHESRTTGLCCVKFDAGNA
jgi:hypothetical protein